jgi:histidinol-phosphate aminotransferase
MSQARPEASMEDAVAAVIRPDVRAMTAYAVPCASGWVKLDAMENPYSLPPAVQHELGQRLAALPLNRYPVPRYARLKRLLREVFAIPEGAELLLGNGSDELISMLSVAVAQPGATLLTVVPTFSMYEMAARLAGVRCVAVPLRPDFSLDGPAMLAAIAQHRPALIWLAYPNNPTGNLFDRAVIESILAAAPGLVVLDEAYQPFAQDSWMPDLPRHERLVVMRTVSKMGLAGIRLGYLAAAPHWVEQFEKVRPPYNVSSLDEAAAEFALEHKALFQAQADQVCADRAVWAGHLARLPGVEVFASQANFLLIRVPDGPATMAGLKQRRILVKDLHVVHPSLRHCLRLTVGTASEQAQCLEALRAIVVAQSGCAGDF